MDKAANQHETEFQVVCAWCGALIRHSRRKNSLGMCLQCHARMLREYTRSYTQAEKSLKSSER
jgi:ribosomal protein L37AE/L43A